MGTSIALMRCMTKYLIIGLAILTSCASAVQSKRNQVNWGMSKAQVVSILGDPDLIEGSYPMQALVYESSEWTHTGDYCVLIRNDSVIRTSGNRWCR